MKTWKADGLEIYTDDKRESFIADVFNETPDAKKNARLIAAAPDLLEAARRALAMMSDIKIPSVKTRTGFSANVTRAALAAAINKAEGEERS